MMTAVGKNADFSGAKRSGNTVPWERLGRFADRQTRQGEPSWSERVNTPALLPQRAMPKIRFLTTAPRGCGDNMPEAVLALQA
jgi:hypothetical protein